MNDVDMLARSAEREAWARAAGNLFRYSGVAFGLAFACVLFGFVCGFYAGGLAAVVWPACVVLSVWFAAGAVAYLLLRDVIFRVLGWLLRPVVGPPYSPGGPDGN